jgi:hypothetical protein
MSGDFSLCCVPQLFSWLSLVQKRVSSAGSSPPPASPYYQYSLLPRDSTESLVIPVLRAYTDVVPDDASPRSSISTISVRSTAISIPSHPSPSLSPSPPDSPSSQQPLLLLDDAERLDSLGHPSHSPLAKISTPSAADAPCPGSTLISQRPASHLEDSICPNFVSTPLAPPALLQLPIEDPPIFQGQTRNTPSQHPYQHNFSRAPSLFVNNALLNDYKPAVDNCKNCLYSNAFAYYDVC